MPGLVTSGLSELSSSDPALFSVWVSHGISFLFGNSLSPRSFLRKDIMIDEYSSTCVLAISAIHQICLALFSRPGVRSHLLTTCVEVACHHHARACHCQYACSTKAMVGDCYVVLGYEKGRQVAESPKFTKWWARNRFLLLWSTKIWGVVVAAASPNLSLLVYTVCLHSIFIID